MNYFKEAAIHRFNSLSKSDVSPYDAKWVVTVPAIWNDGAKQIMREAAYEVNFVSYSAVHRNFMTLALGWSCVF